jgi:Ran GTPase-activating protein (RanGAP) involved in mRNA processing and transport
LLFLASPTKLKNLLAPSELDAAHSLLLAADVGENTTVEVLDMALNSLGDAGAEELARGLARNGALRKLVLQNNLIEEGGCAAIARGLETNTTLTDVDLSENSMGARALAAFAAVLSRRRCGRLGFVFPAGTRPPSVD